MIATGYLQIETYIDHGLALSNCMVRIYSQKNGEINYEDFFMTDQMGRTRMIPLLVDADQSSDHEIECPYEIYHVEIRCTNYRTQIMKGIMIYADESSYLHVTMEKTCSLTEEDVTFINNTSSFSLVDLTMHTELELSILPSRIYVTDGKQNEEVPFSFYLKNCISSLVEPCWSSEIIKVYIMILTSIVLKHLTYNDVLQAYEIKSEVLPYQAKRNLYMRLDRLVDDVFGYYVVWDKNDIDRIKTIIKYPHIMLAYVERGYSAHAILHKIFGQEISVKRLEYTHSLISPFTQIKLHDKGQMITSIQQKLQMIKTFYPVIQECECTGIYDAKTQAAVRSFQQHFRLKSDGIVGKRTYYKLSFLHEWLTEKRNHEECEDCCIKDLNEQNIKEIQQQLKCIAKYYHKIPDVIIDGDYGHKTYSAILAFQHLLGIDANGIIDSFTKKLLQQMYDELHT